MLYIALPSATEVRKLYYVSIEVDFCFGLQQKRLCKMDLSGLKLSVNVTGSRLLLYQKNMWLRTIYCLHIIWWKNRELQWRSWSAAILCGEDMVQAGCD